MDSIVLALSALAVALGCALAVRDAQAFKRWLVPLFVLLFAEVCLLHAALHSVGVTLAAGTVAFLAVSLFRYIRHQEKPLGRFDYRFCPKCSDRLRPKMFEHVEKMACPNPKCQFVHWNNPIVVGVAVIPTRNRDGVVLVKRKINPKAGFYCLPGGFAEPFEHPEETVRREAWEEVTLRVQIDRLLAVHSSSHGNQVLVFYLCKPLDEEPAAGSDAEEAKVFKFDELPTNVAFDSHKAVLDQLQAEFKAAA